MRKTQDMVTTLDGVDWDFPRSRTSLRTVHSFHWFPGNFIPQIPSYFIQLLSEPGEIVCDPFCGSGTTGIEAIRLSRRTWLSDLNRASIQVTRGKFAALVNPRVRPDLESLLRDLVWDSVLRSDEIGRNDEGSNPHLQLWLHDDTLAQLRYLWRIVEAAHYCDLRYLLEVIFSDVLFACASVRGARTSTGGRRRHHWGWIADNVRPLQLIPHNAIKLFRERTFHAVDVLKSEPTAARDSVRIDREDARRLSAPASSVDLVVTSPPYLGMIDYTLANRLTYLWMGWSLTEDRDGEIGARYRRHSAKVVENYLQSMSVASSQIARSLRVGGYCAIVVGASSKFPQAAAKVIQLFGAELNMVWGPKSRIPTRRRVSNRQGTAPSEWLCVFQKVH
jgi:hypothetical protein